MPVGILRVIHTLAIRWTGAFGENLEGRRQCRRFKCIEAWAVAVKRPLLSRGCCGPSNSLNTRADWTFKWSITELTMQVSVTEAKGQLTELVRRAEAGDDVILTRHGHAAVRLVPIKATPDRKSRRTLLTAVRASAAAKVVAGPNAARSQDFLYGDDGLPK